MAKVTVEALKDHTYNGKAYQVGDTYVFEASDSQSGISVDDQVQSLATTGFALRVDRVAHAKSVAKAVAKPAKAAKVAKKSKTSKKR